MNKLIYIADPMCSWCHGFSPILTQLAEHYQDDLELILVMGGLRPGGHTPWDQKMKDFLRHHWEEISSKTGQPFSFELFDQEHFNYDTEPPCRAVCVVRDLYPEKAYLFFKAIQHAFYFLNNDPNLLDFYLPICDQLKIDRDTFSKHFSSENYRIKTRSDFEQSREWGIGGFPSLLVSNGTSLHMVSRGYLGFDQIKNNIDKVFSN